jgi:hypothetical protein
MKVFVYWNLNRKVWSVKALEGPEKGRVVARGGTVLLASVTPKVSEKGRQRVLRERRKHVHAGLVGELVHVSDDALDVPENGVEITYNPYKFRSFVRKSDEVAFVKSSWALLQDKQVFAAGNVVKWAW